MRYFVRRIRFRCLQYHYPFAKSHSMQPFLHLRRPSDLSFQVMEEEVKKIFEDINFSGNTDPLIVQIREMAKVDSVPQVHVSDEPKSPVEASGLSNVENKPQDQQVQVQPVAAVADQSAVSQPSFDASQAPVAPSIPSVEQSNF